MADDGALHDAWQFDHLGIVVGSLEKGRRVLGTTFSIDRWTEAVDDPDNGVQVQFGLGNGGVNYELVVPLSQDSPVFDALKSRKNILNHVAYLVRDLRTAAARMKSAKAFPVTEPTPAVAYGGAPIQFFVTPVGLIVELIEAFDFEHDYRADQ